MKGFISIHDKAGNYLYCSDKVINITGHHSSFYLNKNAYDHFFEEDKISIMKHHLNSLVDNHFYNKDSVVYRISSIKGWTWVKSFTLELYNDNLIVYTRKLTFFELLTLKIYKLFTDLK